MMLMDGGGFRHAPGYIGVSDNYVEMRRRARQGMIDRATSAWDSRIRRREPDDEDRLDRRHYYSAFGQPQRERGRGFDTRSRVADARQRDVADAARMGAYFAMCDRAANAWKRTPNRDWAQPDMGTRPEEMTAYGARSISPPVGRSDPNEDLVKLRQDTQARRDAAYQASVSGLSEAWKMGRTDPSAAGRIENQRERWLGAK
jgi:hypothetical protein